MARRILISSAVVVVVLASVTVVWSGLDLIPVGFLLRYGLHPRCRPSGEIVNAAGIEFVIIRPGCCRMGSDFLAEAPENAVFQTDDTLGNLLGRVSQPVGLGWGIGLVPSEEMPVHWCEFRRGFGIAKTEVTNAEYQQFDPEYVRDECSRGDRDPAVYVSWEQARKYCSWLSRRSGLDVHLPSESEWECACRAGAKEVYPAWEADTASGGERQWLWGTSKSEPGIGESAWYFRNARSGPRAVATKNANVWGLSDMLGNVDEWCEDRWHDSYLLTRKVKQKDGSVATETMDRAPDDGSAWERGSSRRRVLRGGSWAGPASECRPTYRFSYAPSERRSYLGFRPALSLR